MSPGRAWPVTALLLGALLAGCAWSNPANRPVWNAFEAHLVPEDDTAFYASLPLTVPAGLLAILTDTFIVHPAHVVGDAGEDAGDLWRHLDWENHYYTELVVLPLRVVGTPVVFVIMFVARSCFDLPPHPTHGERPTPDAAAGSSEALPEPDDGVGPSEASPEPDEQEREALLALLARIAAGDDRADPAALASAAEVTWNAALGQAWNSALARADAAQRLGMFRVAREGRLPPWREDPTRGLRDASAVVRYEELERLPKSVVVPAALREALLDDPDEAVALLARRRWP